MGKAPSHVGERFKPAKTSGDDVWQLIIGARRTDIIRGLKERCIPRLEAGALVHKQSYDPDHFRSGADEILPGVVKNWRPANRLLVYEASRMFCISGRGSDVKQKFDGPSLEDFRTAVIVGCKSRLQKVNASQIKNLITLTPSEKVEREYSEGALWQAVLRSVYAVMSKEYRKHSLTPPTFDSLFQNPDLTGPKAITKFREIALAPYNVTEETNVLVQFDNMGWAAKPDTFDAGPLEFFLGSEKDERHAVLEEIRDNVFGEEGGYQLINPFQSGMRGGLSALSVALFDENERKIRRCAQPILYIPLHGRSLKSPRDSYPELIYRIFRFYKHMDKNLRREREGAGALSADQLPKRKSRSGRRVGIPRDLDEIVTIIRETRLLMARYPAIIIFDGYTRPLAFDSPAIYRHQSLLRAISDDHVFTLIERLVELPTPTKNHAFDISTFRKNRFVIMSDRPMYHEAKGGDDPAPMDDHPALKSLRGKSIEVPTPERHDKLIDVLGFQTPQQVAWFRKQIGKDTELPNVEDLEKSFIAHQGELRKLCAHSLFRNHARSESVMGLISVLVKLKYTKWTVFKNAGSEADLCNMMIARLLNLIEARSNPDWKLFFQFIALAPGGVRPKTLCRLYESYHRAKYPDQHPPDRKEINRSIIDMLIACSGVLGLYRTDRLNTPKIRKPLEQYRQELIVKDELPTNRAIQFSFAQIGQYICTHFERTYHDYGKVRQRIGATSHLPERLFLHFLMAEEALAQFSILALYDDFHEDTSLRRQRRLLECLYHGAASLGDGHLQTPLPYDVEESCLPSDPKARWLTLYSFIFRRNLDGPPEYPLTRVFAADDVKFDILMCLASPEICRGVTPLGNNPDIGVDESGVMTEFVIDLLSASNAVGCHDAPQIQKLLDERQSRLAGITAPSDNPINYRIEKRLLDIDLGSQAALRGLADVDELVDLRNDFVTPAIDELLETSFQESGFQECVGRVRAQVGPLNFVADRPSRLVINVDASQLSPMNLKALIDLLNRYGEMTGLAADLRDAGRRPNTAEQRVVRLDHSTRLFAESYTAYAVAESFRQHLFLRRPNDRMDVLGGHASRSLIRVLLKLERFAESWLGKGRDEVNRPGWFWRAAQVHSVELGRHLAKYPRERAGILILQSTIARYARSRNYDVKHDYPRFLGMALECLKSAEPLVLKLGMHTRLRFRFALERAKVLLEAARLKAEFDKDVVGIDVSRLLDHAEIDIDLLLAISEGHSDTLWKGLAETQLEKLKMLRDSIAVNFELPQKATLSDSDR
ncbi:MAG: hypothetical protein DHS20C05_20550 [Hyphococcus sp.]|nr:MAG: hypothetical protein DHS20C05_20550 [Marinicaulis sp.]